MAQQITTVTTLVPVVTEEALNRQLRKIGERDSDLAQYASNGWALVHTHAIADAAAVVIVTPVEARRETTRHPGFADVHASATPSAPASSL